ncbi:NAD(P)-binding protein [Daedaleopsis nitida]|nr:NAD(P)-binding protein [Daedaleopsis nitida]
MVDRRKRLGLLDTLRLVVWRPEAHFCRPSLPDFSVMAPVINGRVLYNGIPSGFPIPGKTTIYDESETIDLENELLHGGILVKILDLSIDPYMRHKMQKHNPLDYFPMFEVGEPLTNFGVGIVLRSENAAFKTGDHVTSIFPFQEYVIVRDTQQIRVLDNKENIPLSAYLGVCGMPGQTAHHAWLEFSHAKKGDVAFVTAASGAVGAVVVQLAKSHGLKVIASAGSDEKVDFVRSIGADVAFNYKTTNTNDVLAKEGPINVYWDNVGGEPLEAALEYAAQGAHFIICGHISNYNTTEPYNVKNMQNLIWRQVTLHGFLVTELWAKYLEDFYKTMPALVASGDMKYMEHRVKGLENAGQALLDVMNGRNIGKMVVVVADE